MAVFNIHSRVLRSPPDAVGSLLDALASDSDQLWPNQQWPALHLDRPLAVGAIGGHGHIHYTVIGYQPRRWIRFQFSQPQGFKGFHEFTVDELDTSHTRLTHLLAIRTRGTARISWPLMYRWLHDALLEDALDTAERALTGQVEHKARWNIYVRLLRRRGPGRRRPRATAPLPPRARRPPGSACRPNVAPPFFTAAGSEAPSARVRMPATRAAMMATAVHSATARTRPRTGGMLTTPHPRPVHVPAQRGAGPRRAAFRRG